MQATPSRSRPTSRVGSSSGGPSTLDDISGGAGGSGGPSLAAAAAAAATSTGTPPGTTGGDASAKQPNGRSGGTDLWTDILRSADRQKALARKNVVLLSERHRGRALLLDKLVGKRKARGTTAMGTGRDAVARESAALAIGYEVLEGAERDEDAAPPISLFYPPSSHPTLLRLVDVSLPPNPLPDTAVMIVLDWTKPSTMVRELLTWLAWVDSWAARSDKHGDGPELREKLQSYLQHYAEPSPTAAPNLQPYSNLGTVLPLGPGTLTLNTYGVPIVVVCTRADLMDHVGDEMGMKGGGWEERTDWIQQVIRTVCLSYGAALFYTAPTQPQSYTLLRDYLYHRLYTVPPPLNPPSGSGAGADAALQPPPSRFPFPHRASVLDRDAVLVPAGWDSWGKINVLREGFDPARVAKAWDASAARHTGHNHGTENEDEGLEDLWVAMVPDTERPKPPNPSAVTTTSEPEQAFLQRQLDILLKDPNRDARAAFRHAANSASAAGAGAGTVAAGGQQPGEIAERFVSGVVGPMGNGGLSLPGVEKAMAEMEGEDVKDRFARISRRESTKPAASPVAERSGGAQNEALHNFFQGLLAKKSGQASNLGTPTKAAK